MYAVYTGLGGGKSDWEGTVKICNQFPKSAFSQPQITPKISNLVKNWLTLMVGIFGYSIQLLKFFEIPLVLVKIK